MDWLSNALDFILQSLLSEFVVVAAGVLFALFVRSWWDKWRYGGWRVIIHQHGEQILDREISPAKVKQILDEPTDMAIFVKGVTSPYTWLNCDPLEEGTRLGLLKVNKATRRLVIDLDKNPPRTDYTGVREVPAHQLLKDQTHTAESHSEETQS